MILENDNLKKWKSKLSTEMKKQYDIDDFSTSNTDECWLKNYIGYDTQDIIESEVENWD